MWGEGFFSYDRWMLDQVALINCDGVLAGFYQGVFRLVKEETGVELVESDFPPTWGFLNELPRVLAAHGVSKSNVATSQVLQRMSEPGFCASLPPLPGAIDAMHRLSTRYRIYIATSPWWSFPHWMHERTRWVQSHLGFRASSVIHLSDKELLRGNLLLDDKPDTVRKWAAVNHCQNPAVSPALLWHTYFNEGEPSDDLRRIRTWAEVFELAGV